MLKKGSKRYVSSVVLIIFILSLCLASGCAKTEQPAAVTGEKQTNTRTVVDQAGREVVVPSEVKRAVTTWRPCTFLVYAVGAQSKLVGVDDGSKKDPFTTAVYPQIVNASAVGDKKSGINMEAVIATKPDVVFVWSGKGSEDMIKQLESQKIATLVLIPESAEDMKTATLLLGEVLGCSDQANKVVKHYDQVIADVNNRLKDVPQADRKKVFLAGAQGFLSSCGSDFYQHYLIEKAGGVNVAAELKGGWQNVSPEQLMVWNPDVIIADPYCKDGIDDSLKINPGLQGLNAVKNNELYSFPSAGQWTFPIPQSAMGILWLGQALYPEQFKDINFEETVNQYYKDFFGKAYTEFGGNKLDGKGIPKKINKTEAKS